MTIEQKLRELATKSGMTRRGFMQRALAPRRHDGARDHSCEPDLCIGTETGRPASGSGLGHGRRRIRWIRRPSSTSTCKTVNASARNNLTEVAQDGKPDPRAGRELRHRRRHDVAVQPAPGRRVPQRQDDGLERRHGVHHPPSRRKFEVARQGAAQVHRRDEGGRRERGGIHAERRQRGLPVHPERLSHSDHAGVRTRGGLAVRNRHRRLRARELRARRAQHAEAQPPTSSRKASDTSTRWRSSPSPT